MTLVPVRRRREMSPASRTRRSASRTVDRLIP